MYLLDAYVGHGAQKPTNLAIAYFVMRFNFMISIYKKVNFNELSVLIRVTYFPLSGRVNSTASGHRIVVVRTHRSARCV